MKGTCRQNYQFIRFMYTTLHAREFALNTGERYYTGPFYAEYLLVLKRCTVVYHGFADVIIKYISTNIHFLALTRRYSNCMILDQRRYKSGGPPWVIL